MRVQQPGDRARFARSYGLSIVVHVLFFIFWFSLLAVRIEQGETAGDATSTRITLEARPVPTPAPAVVASPAPPHRLPTVRPLVAKVTAEPLRTRPPSPRAVPTSSPPRLPTPEATLHLSFPPTYRPSAIPSSIPSPAPTAPPSVAVVPTVVATPVPTEPPSPVPTAAPTATPRPLPTVSPTQAPTASPQPTVAPATAPPTARPTTAPTQAPTVAPTSAPTAVPTVQPSTQAVRTTAPSPAATTAAATPGGQATSAASSAASPGRATPGPPLRTLGPIATPIPHPVPPEVARPAPAPAASPTGNPNAASLEERMRRMLGGINEARHYDAKRYEGEVAAAVKRLAQEYDVSHRPPPPNSGVGTYVRAFNFAAGQVLYALRVVNIGPLQVCAGWLVTFTPPNQPPNFYIGNCLKNGGAPIENSDPRERRPGGYPTVPPLHN